VHDWIGSPPMSLAGLRGKVVLVRWFTSPDCPYCHATAPALNRFHHDYARRGLVVVGMYHHKSDDPLTLDAVRGWVREYGFQFPVGVDRDWRTLRRWWLNGTKRAFTSVSFLIDRRGAIRQIHPGGTLALDTPDFRSMQAKIEQLLAE
jgi:peroxiredoxin